MKLLHRIFAVVRFIQVEWWAWLEEQERPLVAAPAEPVVTDPTELRIRAVERDIRSTPGVRHMTDSQVRSAAIGWVEASIRNENKRKEYEERLQKLREKRAAENSSPKP